MKKTEAGPPDNTYSPISCDVYSELELAILHHNRLHLRWRAENVYYTDDVLPLDLQTVDGEELLICRTGDGKTLSIRLDRLCRVAPL